MTAMTVGLGCVKKSVRMGPFLSSQLPFQAFVNYREAFLPSLQSANFEDSCLCSLSDSK
jgi:hypothetical protein